jgi:nitrate reductase delta subunit
MSSSLVAVLDGLGAALEYPRDDYRVRLVECRDSLVDGDPEAAAGVGAFCEVIANLNDTELEELYTRTFDLNPVCTPEVGWHIYGEQYRRGRFLVQARDLLKVVGIEEKGELPDHLMSLLPAVARLQPKDAALFAGTYLVPAVEKMLAGMEDKANPYEQILRAIRSVLMTFAIEPAQVQGPFEDDDLVRIGTPQPPPTQKGAIS